jgi:hypothetical protein
MSTSGWIGVDLDGTLAEYDFWRGINHIGEPIRPMLDRIRKWLEEGREVRIFTARVAGSQNGMAEKYIQEWLRDECYLPPLQVTNVKDFQMVELWDDRAVQVVPNTGMRADGKEDEA